MLSQTLCTVSGAPAPLARSRLRSLLKARQIFHESNGSCNLEANTKHSYETITTTPTMSDHNDNETQESSRARRREQRRESQRMLAKLQDIIRLRITEEDLHKILSAPMEKRDSLTSTVNSPDILWEYVPRELDGFTIDLFTARANLRGAMERVLNQKLNEIPGYRWATMQRQPDGICRYVVCYYRGQGFTLPDYLKDLPFVLTEETIWRPSRFKLESASPVQPGSKLYPKSESSPTLPEVFNGGTVGFIGSLDRGTDVNRVHVLVTVGHVLDDNDASGTTTPG